MKSLFKLSENITFLNHGSFGACPNEITIEQQKIQALLESDPVHFMQKLQPNLLKQARIALADFVHCAAEDLYFTPNPTFAVNTIMRSLSLEPGDEILTTNHEYGAMDRTWRFFCKKSGAKYIRQNITLPIISKEKIVEEFWSGYTSKTKVIFINQISSATAIIFPVKEICEKAQELGLITIVDGAHVPGHIPLNISELNPDYYTGTLHKWMLAPKGSSFLYVKKEMQQDLEPLVVSWGYESIAPSESLFLDYHEYQGTNDNSAFIVTPKVIQFLKENNWELVAASCKKMLWKNYNRFCALLESAPICPITDEFLGQMISIPIRTTNPQKLKDTLYEQFHIQIPIMELNGDYYLRISMNAYNSEEDLNILYRAIEEIITTTELILV